VDLLRVDEVGDELDVIVGERRAGAATGVERGAGRVAEQRPLVDR
jgi:hypothetical protein